MGSMGNETSKSKELTKLEKTLDNCENGSVKDVSVITPNGLEIDANGDAGVQKNGGIPSAKVSTESTDPVIGVVKQIEVEAISEFIEVAREEVKKNKEEKMLLFSKMFKKKTEPPAGEQSSGAPKLSNEVQTAGSVPASDPPTDAPNQKQQPQSLAEPESETPERELQEEKAPESASGDGEPAESIPEENPVMNFFKALVTPTKTAQKETAAPDATKDQSQKVKQPAVTTTVAQVSEPPAAPKAMSVPPPPPPEPPRMEVRAEVAAKPSPRQEPKAAAKAPESSKAKSAKDTLNKLFRTKKMKEEPQPAVDVEVQPVVEVQEAPEEEPAPVVAVQSERIVDAQEEEEKEVAKPVVEEQKVDPSKTGTLEAAPKPEPPPPVQVEKKPQPKIFLSLFKPKAADPNKAAPAPAPAAEAAKAKEEPKVAVKSPEVVVLSKPDSAAPPAGVEVTNTPKKLEKRNSVQKFFKHLGQRRSSTDAGVQTEPVAIAPAAEKAK